MMIFTTPTSSISKQYRLGTRCIDGAVIQLAGVLGNLHHSWNICAKGAYRGARIDP